MQLPELDLIRDLDDLWSVHQACGVWLPVCVDQYSISYRTEQLSKEVQLFLKITGKNNK